MNCPECGRTHVMGCDWCGADLDERDHYESCEHWMLGSSGQPIRRDATYPMDCE